MQIFLFCLRFYDYETFIIIIIIIIIVVVFAVYRNYCFYRPQNLLFQRLVGFLLSLRLTVFTRSLMELRPS